MKIIHSERHMLHATSENVPGCAFAFREVPERAERILAALESAVPGEFRPPDDYDRAALTTVHPEGYLDYLRDAYSLRQTFLADGHPVVAEAFAVRSARRRPNTYPGIVGNYHFDNAAPILAGTWEAVLASANCALTAADAVRSGDRVAYALCRPPGHHAAADLAGGYCYLNNAALASRHLQRGTDTRVAILDVDFHHGNGTQEIFYSDPTVLYLSLHADTTVEYPFFWGGEEETGAGAGEGFNRNFPLPDDTDDTLYLETLDRAIDVLRDFHPEYLVVSAGFDLMEGDPEVLGLGFRITGVGLGEIARRLARLSLPTVLVQEGGYRLTHLGEYAATFLHSFNDAL
ncbi:MAG: histone deacetylase family protein [Capsulimonadales bacterium]|nr:histone deacetylase family protein [Capsulimonadales bacterium]